MLWKVTSNGHPLKRWLTREEADVFAERWQGSHSGNRGLLKHKDRGDWVEVKPDVDANKEFDERYKVAKAGDRQRVIYEQYVQNLDDADPAMLTKE